MELKEQEVSVVSMLVAQEIGVLWESYTTQAEMEHDGVVPHFIEVNQLADRLEREYGELLDRGWDSVKEARDWYKELYLKQTLDTATHYGDDVILTKEDLEADDEIIMEPMESWVEELNRASHDVDYHLELGGTSWELRDLLLDKCKKLGLEIQSDYTNAERIIRVLMPELEGYVTALKQLDMVVFYDAENWPVEEITPDALGMLYGVWAERKEYEIHKGPSVRQEFLEAFCKDWQETPNLEVMREFLDHDNWDETELTEYLVDLVMKYEQ